MIQTIKDMLSFLAYVYGFTIFCVGSAAGMIWLFLWVFG